MLRSMYAGVSGLKAHMDKMDIVGNNISNVNTTGYKASRATFKSMLSQTIQGASSPQDDRGGTNPQQIGLGTTLGSIDKDMSQGNLKSTGRSTDLAIQGNGFFVMNGGGANKYTRAGSMSFDKDGYLVNSTNGYRLQGWQADTKGNINTNGDLEDITLKQSMEAEATDEVTYAGNLDPTATHTVTKEISSGGKNYDVTFEFTKDIANDEWNYKVSKVAGETLDSDSEGTVTFNSDGSYNSATVSDIELKDGAGGTINIPEADITNSSGEFSNVISEEPDPNVRTTTVNLYDSQGTEHTVELEFSKTKTDNEWKYNINNISKGKNIDLNGTGGTSGTVTFDKDGNIKSGGTATLEFLPTTGAAPGGNPNQKVTLDFSDMTQYSSSMTADVDTINGYQAGSLEKFSIGQSGKITGFYDNGQRQTVGQVAVATFNNPAGLNEESDTMFGTSNNSGPAKIGAPNSGGFGTLSAGTLEMSNVDLSSQFTEMITTQRGFQANSKTISTSDQILQELVNLKR